MGSHYGLSRAQRLIRTCEFQEIFANGERWDGSLLTLWVHRSADASLRLGVIASRRAFPRAVDRSRAKRLLREAYRLNRCRLASGANVILIGRKGLVHACRQDVEKDFLAVAQRAGLLQEVSPSI